jgi:hypothetical protein
MKRDAKPNPLVEILITIVIPAVVLMKLSGPERMGPLGALGWAWPSPSAGACGKAGGAAS